MNIASGEKLPLTKIQALETLSGVSLGDMIARYDHSVENKRIDTTAKNLGARFMQRYGKKNK